MDSITAGLRDPYHPENCSKYYNKNFSILWDADRAEEQNPEKETRPGSNPFNRHVRRHKHTFLNTCWAFLTAPRSPEQIQTLAKDMDTRHLDNAEGIDDAGDGFQLALLKMIGFVTLILRLVRGRKSRSVIGVLSQQPSPLGPAKPVLHLPSSMHRSLRIGLAKVKYHGH
ncbi:uncharacterized protein SCHCODRAFT_02605376 [Schizophyllum commune H4-8]|nr:uncharacterized protein SCHCODRAFT_02605376 [Schizophyllum commune H4-8]KAI5899529.1 hypothetical protein SCHCODRAFT_02605376 [Schizophyllum commune H4-8]